MKHEAISRRELPRLIHEIHQSGHWSGKRGGHKVELSIASTIFGRHIAYAVCFRRRWNRGQCNTVAEAVDAINQTVKGASLTCLP